MAKSVFQWNKTIKKLENDLGFGKNIDIFAAESAARYMNPFVPMQTGVLSQTYETGCDELGGFVRYTQPYAHKQFNGDSFNFSKEQHPLATSHWDKAMLAVNGEKLASEVSLYRKRFVK